MNTGRVPTELYVHHEGGATHAVRGRQLAALVHTLKAGLATEVNRLLAAGYTEFMSLRTGERAA